VSTLPVGWVKTALDRIVDRIAGGGTPSKSNASFFKGAIPFMTVKDMTQRFPVDTQEHISEKAIEQSATTLVPRDTLIVATRMSLGKIVRPKFDTAINQDLKALFLNENVDKTFVEYWWRHKADYIQSLGTGTTVQGIRLEAIRSLSIDVPPLNEQKRIADKLDVLFARVDACCVRLDRVRFIIKRFRQAILAAATSGQLTEEWRAKNRTTDSSDQTKVGLTGFDFADAICFGDYRFPASWRAARLEDIAEIVGGITKDSKKQDPADEELPYLRVANVQRGFLDLSEIKTIRVPRRRIEELLLQRGDILFNEGGDIDKLGRGWVWFSEIERCTFQNHVFRARLHKKSFEPKFFSWYGNSRGFDYFLSVGKQTTNLASINKTLLSALPIVIPPPEEQREIVRRCEVLFAYADRLEARYQAARTQVKNLTLALLAKAFRGELVSQDPNDEPAAVLLERIRAEKARMETVRKTTRIVRRSTKESPQDIMKQPSDYWEALRSAFVEMGRKADARQLFDQAGFSPEEVVQFYEVLRATPEVRVAFEEVMEERPQQQSSIVDGTDKSTMTNGRFRLVELWLEDFKNLTDYTVHFDPSHGIDIVLGWNGTGKSNLFEALVIIFRDLHKWWEKNQWPENPMKGYRLRYEIDEKTLEVSWHPGEMKRPKLKMGILQESTKEPDKLESITRKELPLPRFVFGYYSGPTNRLVEHFWPMKKDHYDRLRTAESDDLETLARLLQQRRFFCAENHHAKYVLLAFFHKDDADIRHFLEDRLRIVGFESALFIIRKPAWARSGQTAKNFWGATGIMRRVMERLRRYAIAPMVVEQTIRDGYRSRREDHYYFFLPDLKSLHAFAAEYHDARTFFVALESTDFSELIYDLKIQVRVKATNTEQVAITFHELSEGEQQLLMVLGLMRFTKSHQSLVLLDEPDTHLNPHWSVDYLKLLTRVMSEDSSESEEQQTSQILMSTHDPLVIASLFKEQIHLLKRDWQTGVCKWTQPTVNPRGLGFTGILTSEMFGMRSDLDEETLADLDNKVRLIAKEGSLTSDEVADLEEINKRLEDAGFQKAFSDPYYAAFVRAWGQRHSELMAGVRFLNPEQKEEIDRIAREVLEEVMAELKVEAAG
jgi:type I restriction enzyme S subunit